MENAEANEHRIKSFINDNQESFIIELSSGVGLWFSQTIIKQAARDTSHLSLL